MVYSALYREFYRTPFFSFAPSTIETLTCDVVKEPDVAVLVCSDCDGEGGVIHHTIDLVVATIF
jgi:hypothetical protein